MKRSLSILLSSAILILAACTPINGSPDPDTNRLLQPQPTGRFNELLMVAYLIDPANPTRHDVVRNIHVTININDVSGSGVTGIWRKFGIGARNPISYPNAFTPWELKALYAPGVKANVVMTVQFMGRYITDVQLHCQILIGINDIKGYDKGGHPIYGSDAHNVAFEANHNWVKVSASDPHGAGGTTQCQYTTGSE